jgi:hypothetical protein
MPEGAEYDEARSDDGPAGTEDSPPGAESHVPEPAAAPSERGERVAWGASDHADPALLAGRPRSAYVYVVALVAAAVADVAAFYQVLELVMANSAEYLVFILVIGFTGVVLTLAHFAGVILRDRFAGARSIRAFLAPACLLVWLALGGLAFYVRFKIDAGGSASAPTLSVSPTGPGSSGSAGVDPQDTLPGAAVFIGLYAATGTVALVGGYLMHNPLRAAFARALRAYRSAAEVHAVASRRLAAAEAVRNFRADELVSAERIREEALQQRLALAEELKQTARLEISRRLQDASATDTFVKPDARPYTYRPFSN